MQASKQAGRFQIRRVLGSGGKGVVYAALDGDHEIALKLLREDLVASEKERRQFVREAEVMARVSHPALVRVLEAGELPDGRPYLCMPLLDGETLAARVARGALALDAALDVFEKLVGATAAIHDEGLVHRDIKPENVLITDETGPILLDLGLAREAGSKLTTTGVVTGTRAYMAPERFFGRAATVASDVYELALVLYLMLTGGSLPWTDDSDPQARLNPTPLEAHLAPSDRARIVSAAVARALSPRPELRFASVRELLAEVRRTDAGDAAGLARVTEDLPVVAAPPSLAASTEARFVEQPRRGRRPLLAAAAAFVFVGGVSVAILRTKLAPTPAPTTTSATVAAAPDPEASSLAPSEAASPSTKEPTPESAATHASAAPARSLPPPRAKSRARGAHSGPAHPASVPVDDRTMYEHR